MGKVVIVAGVSFRAVHIGTKDLHEPGVADEHRAKVGGHRVAAVRQAVRVRCCSAISLHTVSRASEVPSDAMSRISSKSCHASAARGSSTPQKIRLNLRIRPPLRDGSRLQNLCYSPLQLKCDSPARKREGREGSASNQLLRWLGLGPGRPSTVRREGATLAMRRSLLPMRDVIRSARTRSYPPRTCRRRRQRPRRGGRPFQSLPA
jgi:hypothetical protein